VVRKFGRDRLEMFTVAASSRLIVGLTLRGSASSRGCAFLKCWVPAYHVISAHPKTHSSNDAVAYGRSCEILSWLS
jgi:hypothetical protein